MTIILFSFVRNLSFLTLTWFLQAHMQARFVILRVLLEAGEGLVGLKECTGADGRPDAIVTLDRSKIHTVGKSAIQRFLCKLQVREERKNKPITMSPCYACYVWQI